MKNVNPSTNRKNSYKCAKTALKSVVELTLIRKDLEEITKRLLEITGSLQSDATDSLLVGSDTNLITLPKDQE